MDSDETLVALHKAIENHIQACWVSYDGVPPATRFINQWVLTAHISDFEDSNFVEYFVESNIPASAPHVIKGLLMQGVEEFDMEPE